MIPLLIAFFIWSFYQKRRLLRRIGDEELVQQLTLSTSRRKQN